MAVCGSGRARASAIRNSKNRIRRTLFLEDRSWLFHIFFTCEPNFILAPRDPNKLEPVSVLNLGKC